MNFQSYLNELFPFQKSCCDIFALVNNCKKIILKPKSNFNEEQH